MKLSTQAPGRRLVLRGLPPYLPIAGALLLFPSSAFADSVTDWSAFADQVIAKL